MCVDGNDGSAVGYEPNSQGEWLEQPNFAEPPLVVEWRGRSLKSPRR